MISNSIKQFRAQRSAKSKYSSKDTGSTKQRLGLARRQIANSTYEDEQEARAYQASQQEAQGPSAKVNTWMDTIEELREERRKTSGNSDVAPLGSYSSTGEPPTMRPKSQILNMGADGRAAAENYLGSKLEQTDWEMLVRATYAETSSNPEEKAAAMSVMLNRVKSKRYPDTIKGVLNQRNQFQAVTGTSKNPGPSDMFLSFGDKNMATFESESAPLLNNFLKNNWLNFTAADPKAYGEGTDISFRDSVNSSEGSRQIGGTFFGTVRNK